MAAMNDDELADFLSTTRQAILLSTGGDGSAHGVPVWFDWDGDAVRFFSSATAAKIARIRRDPRISLLVMNEIHEPPMWVRFEGRAELAPDEDARHLAVDVLAPRYWDLTAPDYAAVVGQWRAAPDGALVVIRLRPDRIRSSGG